MPKKFDRCVEKVKQSGSAANPYAICQKTVGKGKKKKKKGKK